MSRWMVTFAMAWAASAQAEPVAGRKSDPIDAGASVPAVVYESALSRYRRAADERQLPWRESNDTAARIGGWRAYARESQPPEPLPMQPTRDGGKTP